TAPEFVMVMALASTLTSADPTLLMFAAYALGAYGQTDRWAGAGTVVMVAGAGLVYTAPVIGRIPRTRGCPGSPTKRS
ncbi:hypothetical protein, partial [Streptomyces lavendulae]|uniref:hypothetical protein n=1 Tax=Streptomyces lavendulae TaxID=1914 RepID=UPI0036E513BF